VPEGDPDGVRQHRDHELEHREAQDGRRLPREGYDEEPIAHSCGCPRNRNVGGALARLEKKMAIRLAKPLHLAIHELVDGFASGIPRPDANATDEDDRVRLIPVGDVRHELLDERFLAIDGDAPDNDELRGAEPVDDNLGHVVLHAATPESNCGDQATQGMNVGSAHIAQPSANHDALLAPDSVTRFCSNRRQCRACVDCAKGTEHLAFCGQSPSPALLRAGNVARPPVGTETESRVAVGARYRGTMRSREDDADTVALSRLGYVQELLRAMGGFSNFALSFSIISVLTGVMTAYDVAIRNGGPAALGIGWPLVCLGTLFVALAMAELASAFPTAGAMYHWAAHLGGPGWGWFTACMNIVGQMAIIGAIDLGCAEQATAAMGLGSSLTVPLFSAIVISQGVLNVLSLRLVARLNDFSASVHMAGVAVLVALLLIARPARPLAFVVQTGFTTRVDGSYPLGFASSLLLGMWTFTGFDASAHASEETHDPARRVPWGILLSVGVSAIAGYALVLAITLGIRDLAATAADGHPALLVLRSALGPGWGSTAMGLALAAMWFCGLSAVTSASRALYAFARDGGLPGSGVLRSVGRRRRTPHVAIAACVVVALAIGILGARLTEDQFLAVASLATTALYVSYALPIALGAIARHRGTWRERGPWSLGKAGAPVAWAAVGWSAAVLATFGLPHSGSYLLLLAGIVGALWILYAVFARGRFTGPRAQASD